MNLQCTYYRLTVIDAGIVAAFGDERIKDFRSFLRYICKRDTARIADKIIIFRDDSCINSSEGNAEREQLHSVIKGELDDIFGNFALMRCKKCRGGAKTPCKFASSCIAHCNDG